MKRKRVVESFRSAAETIGPITKEMSLFALSRGQFSMIDMIHHCLKEIGVAQISVWTWTIADYEIEAMESLLLRKEIISGALVIDASADRRNQVMINRWRDRFGEDKVKVCKNHAKIARVWNDTFR